MAKQSSCSEELTIIKNLIRQIRNVEDKALRQELCQSAIDLCDDAISEVEVQE